MDAVGPPSRKINGPSDVLEILKTSRMISVTDI